MPGTLVTKSVTSEAKFSLVGSIISATKFAKVFITPESFSTIFLNLSEIF